MVALGQFGPFRAAAFHSCTFQHRGPRKGHPSGMAKGDGKFALQLDPVLRGTRSACGRRDSSAFGIR